MKIFEVRKNFYDREKYESVWNSNTQQVDPPWASLTELWIIGPLPDPIHQHPALFDLVRHAFKVIWFPEPDKCIVIKDFYGKDGAPAKLPKWHLTWFKARLLLKGRRRKDIEKACMRSLESRIVKTCPIHG